MVKFYRVTPNNISNSRTRGQADWWTRIVLRGTVRVEQILLPLPIIDCFRIIRNFEPLNCGSFHTWRNRFIKVCWGCISWVVLIVTRLGGFVRRIIFATEIYIPGWRRYWNNHVYVIFFDNFTVDTGLFQILIFCTLDKFIIRLSFLFFVLKWVYRLPAA